MRGLLRSWLSELGGLALLAGNAIRQGFRRPFEGSLWVDQLEHLGVQSLTITNVTCTLRDTLTGRQTFASTVSFSGATLEFVLDDFGPTPAYLLLPNTNYTVTIKGGVGGVADLAGNPMATDFGWTFTTAAMAP